MAQVADQSGLSRDGDIATAYAVRTLVEAGPDLAEVSGARATLGSGIAAAGKFTRNSSPSCRSTPTLLPMRRSG